MKNKLKILSLLLLSLSFSFIADAQQVWHDDQKDKQWHSMENGPWDFSPDWYYYFLHKNYSGAEMYWKWAGFKSGYRVRFKEEKSNVKRIMPVRITAEETQRQKLSQAEKERKYVEELWKEEVAREADRTVDLVYSSYKDDFERMEKSISEGLVYCHTKSDGKLQAQIDEINRVYSGLCSDISYIHKTGVGYQLENAKRQKAYEEIKTKMGKLVTRTVNPPGFGPAIAMAKSLGLLLALCVGAYESWMMMLGRRGMDVMKLLRIIGISLCIANSGTICSTLTGMVRETGL